MSKKLRALLERKAKLVAEAKAIQKKAEDDNGRDATDEERTELDAKLAQIEALNGDIDRQRQLDAAETATQGQELTPAVSGGEPNVIKDPKWGFKSFGEYCREVKSAGQPGGHASERLQLVAAAPSTYGSEGVGADGGYLVPPEFASQVFTHALGDDAIMPMTDNIPVGGNSMTFPKDETTPWGTDGIRAYWESEAAAATQTKPKLGITQLRLHKLFALVPITDELGEDASALSTYLERKMGDSIRWKSNDALVNGSGAGQPLGVLNGAALVSVAKEGSQAADTLVVGNVAKMFARMPASSLRRAVWLINNDVLPQLITMVLNDQPIWTPPGALANAPAGSVLGRPVIPSQHCKTLGDKGDIYFVDWMAYRTITKRFGIQVAQSIHLYFDAGATAFRATFRVDGQPAIAQSITPARGSNNLSPFVTLDERA